jgi:23S rRNA (adenine2503-C2)-methyltransferase
MDKPVDLLGLPMPALRAYLDQIGVGAVQGPRVFGGLHRLQQSLQEIPDLGRHAERIAATSEQASVTVLSAHEDAGTEKLVIALRDGARVEAVLIPMHDGRLTLCVSSQVGCAMACTFCATGTLGLTRGLTAGEIVAQVYAASAWAARDGRRVTRLVFMGMGEPLHHYEATRDAVGVLLDQHGRCFGAKNITVSTVGLVPKLRRFAADFGGRLQLAISLHAGTDATRRRIVPTAVASSLADLKQAALDYPLPGSRMLMIEYVLLPGVNDTAEELTGLAAWMDGIDGVVNLIPFNPFAGATFRSPTTDEVWAACHTLQAAGVVVTVRWPRGRGANGACGQLALVPAEATA